MATWSAEKLVSRRAAGRWRPRAPHRLRRATRTHDSERMKTEPYRRISSWCARPRPCEWRISAATATFMRHSADRDHDGRARGPVSIPRARGTRRQGRDAPKSPIAASPMCHMREAVTTAKRRDEPPRPRRMSVGGSRARPPRVVSRHQKHPSRRRGAYRKIPAGRRASNHSSLRPPQDRVISRFCSVADDTRLTAGRRASEYDDGAERRGTSQAARGIVLKAVASCP